MRLQPLALGAAMILGMTVTFAARAADNSNLPPEDPRDKGKPSSAKSGSYEEVCYDVNHGGLDRTSYTVYEELKKVRDKCIAGGNPPDKCPEAKFPPRSKAQMEALAAKTKYCNAYKVAKRGESANGSQMGIWAMAGTACAVRCFANFYVPPTVCQIPAGVAFITEMTQKDGLSNMMSTIMSAAPMMMMGGMMGGGGGGGVAAATKVATNTPPATTPPAGTPPATTPPAGTPPANAPAAPGSTAQNAPRGKGDTKDACMMMAFSLMQVMSKSQGKGESRSTAENALAQARSLNMPKDDAAAVTVNDEADKTVKTDPSDAIAAPKDQTATAGITTDPCDSYVPGNPQSTVACASTDPKTAAFLKGNNVTEQFASVTKQDPGAFLAKGDFSAKGMGEALKSSGMPSDQAAAVGGALAKAESEYKPGTSEGSSGAGVTDLASNSASDGAYRGGAGGGKPSGSGGAGEGDGMDEAMKALLGQIAGGGGPAGGNDAQMAAIQFAIKRDGVSNLPNVKTIGLFDRATYRYREIDKQWSGGTARAPASVSTGPAPR